jgi:hypothetical protein
MGDKATQQPCGTLYSDHHWDKLGQSQCRCFHQESAVHTGRVHIQIDPKVDACHADGDKKDRLWCHDFLWCAGMALP